MFGLEWSVYPPLVSEEQWGCIQQRLTNRANRHAPSSDNAQSYLAAGILRCSCGMMMRHHLCALRTHQYVCSEAAVPRVDKTRKHVTLNMKDVDAFLNELMESHPAVIRDTFRHSSKGQELQRDIARLRAEAEEFRQKLPAIEAQHLKEARDKAAQIGLFKSEAVQAIFKSLMEDDLEAAALTENLLKERQYRLSTLLSEDHLQTIEERIAAWRSMDVAERNALLRTLFECFQVKGSPPNEYIIVKLRTLDDNELPPIYLNTTVRKIHLIRLPTVAEWFASWQRHVHGKEPQST
jgi:hypothetical protein